MKRYQSHKIVEAAPIVGWSPGMGFVTVRSDKVPEKINVPDSFFAPGSPSQGDYLVHNVTDEHFYWLPKKVFEDDYTLMG